MQSPNTTELNSKGINKIHTHKKLFHPGLKELLHLEQYCNRNIEFLSIEVTLPPLFKKFTQLIPVYILGLHLRREYRHFTMGIMGLQSKNCDTLFVFEAYNQHFLLLLPLLVLSRKEVLIMLHGNQQFALNSKLKYWGLLYLKLFLNFFKSLKVVLLELDDEICPKKVRLPDRSKIIIPHPIVEELTPDLSLGIRKKSQKIKIGIVGIIRSDKPIEKIITQVEEYLKKNTEAELIIGTPLKQKSDYLSKLNATIKDTTKEEDYFKVLQEIDILIVHYDRDRYYYRTSGVVSDAGSAGCYIIASDYPLIKHQIEYPVTIGDTFTNFTELDEKIDSAIAFIRENGRDNHWLWREKRNVKSIAKILFPQN